MQTEPLNPSTGLNILVVDDDESFLESLQGLLVDEGHETYAATNGGGAVELARRLREEKRRLDLSILDYHMPDQTGLDVFLTLSRELPRLEAIFVTAAQSVSLQEKFRKAGVRAVLPKPFDIGSFRGAVKAVWRDLRKGGLLSGEPVESELVVPWRRSPARDRESTLKNGNST